MVAILHEINCKSLCRAHKQLQESECALGAFSGVAVTYFKAVFARGAGPGRRLHGLQKDLWSAAMGIIFFPYTPCFGIERLMGFNL
jgi:hypothetical protein